MSTVRRGGAEAVIAEQCLARSARGVAAAASPAAAIAGVEALRAGGNAYDAVVAAALVETVTLPPKCGLAGDLVALAWPVDDDAPAALLAIGGAARGLADVAAQMTATGPLSIGVPGAPAGYLALAERARRPLATNAAAAIDLATNGFAWSEICAVLGTESAELINRHQPDGTVYFPRGEPLAGGTIITLPGLAAALQAFVDEREGFLSGAVGAAIVERVAAVGGVVDADDLRSARAEWTTPASDGDRRWATPAPTHGPSLLDVATTIGPDATPADVAGAVRAAIDRRRRLADPSGTSMVSAIDADGTIVVVVHSNSFPRFGSGIIVDDYDLILNNRAGRGFSTEPGHPNFPAPGRRPATTLHAWALRDTAGQRLVGATPGGANQMPWNAQTLARLDPDTTLRPIDLAAAVVAPRWQLDDDGSISVEEPLAADALAAVATTRPVERWALRSAMQIVGAFDGAAAGVADPRTVGAALPA